MIFQQERVWFFPNIWYIEFKHDKDLFSLYSEKCQVIKNLWNEGEFMKQADNLFQSLTSNSTKNRTFI